MLYQDLIKLMVHDVRNDYVPAPDTVILLDDKRVHYIEVEVEKGTVCIGFDEEGGLDSKRFAITTDLPLSYYTKGEIL